MRWQATGYKDNLRMGVHQKAFWLSADSSFINQSMSGVVDWSGA